MSMTKVKEQEQAIQLRKRGYSLSRIAKELNVAKSSASGWVSDLELTKDELKLLDENNRLYFLNGTRSHVKKCLDDRIKWQEIGRQKIRNGASDKYIAGIMLYWAEGSKAINQISFSNSDFNMMKIFLDFLINEIGIDEKKISFRVHTYLNCGMTLKEIENYWLNFLDLPEISLRKSFVKKEHGSKRKMLKYGVGCLRIGSVRVVQEIYGAIQEYAGFNNPEWAE